MDRTTKFTLIFGGGCLALMALFVLVVATQDDPPSVVTVEAERIAQAKQTKQAEEKLKKATLEAKRRADKQAEVEWFKEEKRLAAERETKREAEERFAREKFAEQEAVAKREREELAKKNEQLRAATDKLTSLRTKLDSTQKMAVYAKKRLAETTEELSQAINKLRIEKAEYDFRMSLPPPPSNGVRGVKLGSAEAQSRMREYMNGVNPLMHPDTLGAAKKAVEDITASGNSLVTSYKQAITSIPRIQAEIRQLEAEISSLKKK